MYARYAELLRLDEEADQRFEALEEERFGPSPPGIRSISVANTAAVSANGQALAYIYFEDEAGWRAGGQAVDP